MTDTETKTRRTPEEIAQENLATAERVHEKAKGRVEATKAAHEKALADEKMAGRKVRAARLVVEDEDEPEIDATVVSADETLI